MIPFQKTHPQTVLSYGEHAGFAWLTAHNNLGYRTGYVRVPAGHPWHGKDYENVNADVHGGLTYSEFDTDKNFFWIGFDCGHSGDAMDPKLATRFMPYSKFMEKIHAGDVIRTQEYVEGECRKLCDQAKEAK